MFQGTCGRGRLRRMGFHPNMEERVGFGRSGAGLSKDPGVGIRSASWIISRRTVLGGHMGEGGWDVLVSVLECPAKGFIIILKAAGNY